MEHLQKSMRRKWERHYRETKGNWAIMLMMFAACIFASLVFIWPQYLSKQAFNSRMLYHLIIDIEDYFTCSKDYVNFVVDEPSDRDVLLSIYVFNVSNARDVFERGYKPSIEEAGPFGFRKNTYKYDVYFEPEDSLYVKFKEFSRLDLVTTPGTCEDMFFQSDRAFLTVGLDLCPDNVCKCKDPDTDITVVNPLFLKMIWKETPHELLAFYGKEVMNEVKDLIEIDFVRAIRAHMVPIAFQEITLFRTNLQTAVLLNDSFTILFSKYTYNQIDHLMKSPVQTNLQCNSAKYSKHFSYCPINLYADLQALKADTFRYDNASMFEYPSLNLLINSSYNHSILNFETGLPLWMAIAWNLNFVEFNLENGYSTITTEECSYYYNLIINDTLTSSFGSTQVSYYQRRGAEILVQSVAHFISYTYLKGLSGLLTSMMYDEFVYSYEPVVCSPWGHKCIWQWGYMRHLGNNHAFSNTLISSFIDLGTKVNTNPNNMFYDGNSPAFYNSNTFCKAQNRKMEPVNASVYCEATDIGYTEEDAILIQPAGLWGVDNSVSTVNRPELYANYLKQPLSTRLEYFYLACNVSYLMHEVYRSSSDFHDFYTIRYLNSKRPSEFTHEFTVGNWKEIGWAQWGSGIITEGVVGVKAIYQVQRDGMWYFGTNNFYRELIEFSSWANKAGFPIAYIFDIQEAKTLLYALADQSQDGVDFRRHIIYSGTTFIGDGIHIVNEVGKVGEVLYIPEADRGNFSCTGVHAEACKILNVRLNSSAAQCEQVENYYYYCDLYAFRGNKWATNCDVFQTSMSSAIQGIQCDKQTVYGHEHPYEKSRGNIVYSMLYSMAIDLKLKEGLWCQTYQGCAFENGGMFTTTTVQQLLFEGYSDPSIIYYLNLKFGSYGIKFRCRNNPVDACGKTLYMCDKDGLTMHLPQGKSKNLTYGDTPNEEYFAPYFVVVTATGEMLWPFASDLTKVAYALNKIATVATIEVINPHWALFPAWSSSDDDFNKFYQCQKRLYSGHPSLFTDCFDTLDTGRQMINNTLQMIKLRGNDTIYHFGHAMSVNGSTEHQQFPMFLWDGFLSYPYLYSGSQTGKNRHAMKYPNVFDKLHGYHFELSQRTFIFDWEINIPMRFPLSSNYGGTINGSKSLNIISKRFVETKETWDYLRALGQPKDSYGMPYIIPRGMASLERLAGFPIYIGTPHCYGNQMWGGMEFGHVSGYNPNQYAQRTFVDYDPVTGLGLRNAIRQQVQVRIEKGPLFPNAFSSQQRCIAPTKSFSGYSGYGCFSYVPIFWFEDAKIMNVETFFRMHDHFYSRPDRAMVLVIIGSIVGGIVFLTGLSMYITESYRRRKFEMRVYVD